jgi:hypothetical protein
MIWRQPKDHQNIEVLAAQFRAEMWGVDNGNDINYNDADARGLLMEHHCALDPLFESSFSLTVSRLSSQSRVNDFIHDLNLSKYQDEVISLDWKVVPY